MGSSYRGSNCRRCMTKIQGKSILARVNTRLELALVRVSDSTVFNIRKDEIYKVVLFNLSLKKIVFYISLLISL